MLKNENRNKKRGVKEVRNFLVELQELMTKHDIVHLGGDGERELEEQFYVTFKKDVHFTDTDYTVNAWLGIDKETDVKKTKIQKRARYHVERERKQRQRVAEAEAKKKFAAEWNAQFED